MANSLSLGSNPTAGLGTFSYTVPAGAAALPYTVECKSTIPVAADSTSGQQSNVQIVINHNGSPIVTVGGSSQNPTTTQGSIAAITGFQAVATDTISVVLSSSNAIDSVPNTVKSVINLFVGPQ